MIVEGDSKKEMVSEICAFVGFWGCVVIDLMGMSIKMVTWCWVT